MSRIIKYYFYLALFMLTFISCTQSEQNIKIGYIQVTQDEVLDAAKDALFKILADSGFVNGENIKLIENNAQGDLSLIPTILQSFQSQGVDMIITNSTPCMVAAAQIIKEIPVVFTVSFAPHQLDIKSTPANLYGIYDPLHSTEIIAMMRECLPGIQRIGLPYNNAEPNAALAARVFTDEFKKLGIEIVPASVNSSNDIHMAGQYLVGQKIDAIMIAGDNTVYQGINLLSKIAGESKIPLFVTDVLQVKKGAA
ncbi:MAG: ABC transporter substrate-binding protein, partial [Prolixibacteraceae bacterium]|nr:ABC transporter substrate-binding protein [Prolixibacteraceae bacterium]